jgi:hypothetical protein
MDSVLHALKVAGFFALMVLWVPLAGFLVTGTWRGAVQALRSWGRVMLWMVVVACLVFLASQVMTR